MPPLESIGPGQHAELEEVHYNRFEVQPIRA